MLQNLNIGCTTFCEEACSVVVKATLEKLMVTPKKKVIRFSDSFFKKIDACVWLFIFTYIFRLGTFLDIWVCLAKQNGSVFYQKYIKCKFKVSNNINRSYFTDFFCK